MGWVLLEIIVPLLLAVALGVFLGWMLWRWRRTKVTYSEWESERSTTLDSVSSSGSGERAGVDGASAMGLIEAQAADSTIAVDSDLDQNVSSLTADLAASNAQVSELELALSAATARLSELDEELAQLGRRRIDLEGEAANANDLARQAQAELAMLTAQHEAERNATLSHPEDPERSAGVPGTTAAIDLRSGSGPGAFQPGDSADLGEGGAERFGIQALSGDETGQRSDVIDPSGTTAVRGADAPVESETSSISVAAPSASFLIKGNVDSMLYHRPDSRSYQATIAEALFATEEAAVASGFRLAGSHPRTKDGDPGLAVLPDHTSELGLVSDRQDRYELADGEDEAPFGEGSLGRLADRSVIPAAFPIKGNADSMLYHRPDSRNYGATVAEVWFDSPERAEGAGFALAPRHPKADAPSPSAAPAEVAIPSEAAIPSETVAPAETVIPSATVASTETADADTGPYGVGSHAPLSDRQQMPEGYPIKGNADSMLYHRPDSHSYKQTIAEVWFDDPESAESAGFKLARSHPRSKPK